MWQAILDGMKAVIQWFLDLLKLFADLGVQAIQALLPQSMLDQLHQSDSTIGYAISAANAWAPIDFALSLALLYITFVVGFLVVKIGLKLIP